MNIQSQICELSRRFGDADHVVSGGGNTSAKNEHTLYIKPSGTTIGELTENALLPIDRRKLAALYSAVLPSEPMAREAAVKDIMLAAVVPGYEGRPSVETLMHDSFDATFVIHTHPPLVNGMTCAVEGKQIARTLFPDALWMETTDPGYTLSMRVHAELARFAARRGQQPDVLFLQNHGIVFAGNDEPAVLHAWNHVRETLLKQYAARRIPPRLSLAPNPSPSKVEAVTSLLRNCFGDAAAHVRACGAFPVSEGPISPDHVVYMKAYPFIGEPTPDALKAFLAEHGYVPRIVAAPEGVFGVGATEKQACIALEIARDGALVRQLSQAFGGLNYLSQQAADFIDNWEVEAYRRSVANG